jgi:hypothetical protein
MDFQQADRRYADLKQQYDNGALSDEEFRAELEQTAVQDAEGRWWVKHRDTGAWHYQAGDTWVQGTPPYDGPATSGATRGGTSTSSGGEPGGTASGGSDTITVEPIPGWWIPVGITSSIVSFIIPGVGIVLPMIGIYLGYRARQRTATTGATATIIVGIVCLFLRFLLLINGW